MQMIPNIFYLLDIDSPIGLYCQSASDNPTELSLVSIDIDFFFCSCTYSENERRCPLGTRWVNGRCFRHFNESMLNKRGILTTVGGCKENRKTTDISYAPNVYFPLSIVVWTK
jgi:hypothetical protein